MAEKSSGDVVYDQFKDNIYKEGGLRATLNVITRFHAFQQAKGFFKDPYFHNSLKTFPLFELTPYEVQIWDETLGLHTILEDKLRSNKLYIPDLSQPTSSKLINTEHGSTGLEVGNVRQRGAFSRARIVNLFYQKQFRNVPVGLPLNIKSSEDVKFWGFPRWFHDSYGAAIYYEITALDKNGMPLVEAYADLNTMQPVFCHTQLVIAELGFNPVIAKGKPNRFFNKPYGENRKDLAVAVNVEINDPSTIDVLPIPNDPKIKLAFWQINNHLSNQTSGLLASSDDVLNNDLLP